MNEEIKEILERLKDSVDYPKIDMPTFDGTDSEYIDNDTFLEPDECKILLDYITNLQQKNERLEKNNNELRKIYKNTCKHLFNIEHDELATSSGIRPDNIQGGKPTGVYEMPEE